VAGLQPISPVAPPKSPQPCCSSSPFAPPPQKAIQKSPQLAFHDGFRAGPQCAGNLFLFPGRRLSPFFSRPVCALECRSTFLEPHPTRVPRSGLLRFFRPSLKATFFTWQVFLSYQVAPSISVSQLRMPAALVTTVYLQTYLTHHQEGKSHLGEEMNFYRT